MAEAAVTKQDLEVFEALADTLDPAEKVAGDIVAEHEAKVEQPKLPTTAEELDQEYFRFYDLRVYTKQIVDIDLEYALTQEDIDAGNEYAFMAYIIDRKQYLGSDHTGPKLKAGDTVPVLEELEILDVLATHEKIEAAKARGAARRARKFCQVAPDLKDREGDSRQVKRNKAHLRETYRPNTEHVGFNRAGRRTFMSKMPRGMRIAMKHQMAEQRKKSATSDTKTTDTLDKQAEGVV